MKWSSLVFVVPISTSRSREVLCTSKALIKKSLGSLFSYLGLQSGAATRGLGGGAEKGKREVYCDKQVGKAVTVLNCMLKGSWEERGSEGIRKKLKSKYAAYLKSKYRRNNGNSI